MCRLRHSNDPGDKRKIRSRIKTLQGWVEGKFTCVVVGVKETGKVFDEGISNLICNYGSWNKGCIPEDCPNDRTYSRVCLVTRFINKILFGMLGDLIHN